LKENEMNSIDDFTKKDVFKLAGWAFVGILAVGTAGFVLKTVFAPMNAVSGVVSKTLDPNNIIARYEWYHDAYGTFKSRVNQIKVSKSDMTGVANDPAETGRLRIELRAQQQNCRQLAEQYNANATKTNQSIFMGREAPSRLDASMCE
jgi:hypothetical protein